MSIASQPAALERIAERLSTASERHATPPFARIPFSAALDTSRPVMPESLLSLAGHPVLETLDAAARWRLGLLETVNFFSLNIHGEQALVAQLAARLYRGRWSGESPAVSRYLQHFIHEENAHTYMLAEFCQRYYGAVMPEIVFRFQEPALSRGATDLLFFGRVLVLETLLDTVNRAVMDDTSVEPVARAVHRAHHEDELRHMAFDRAVVGSLVAELEVANAQGELRDVAGLLASYADYAFARLANPRVYRELGLPDPLRLVREAAASPARAALRAAWQRSVDPVLGRHGLLPVSGVPDGG